EAMRAKDKAARNLALVESALADVADGSDGDRATLLLDLGRSLKADGRLAEAVDRLGEAVALAPGSPVARAALGFRISCLLGLGRVDEAMGDVARLQSSSSVRSTMPDFL